MSSRNDVEVKHVTKIISNKGRDLIILKDVSFSLEAGTITAIVGKSGCGKSTLLSIVSGIDTPTSGTVNLAGIDYYNMSTAKQGQFRNEHIGMVFQNYHLIPELTCEENIRMPLCFSEKAYNEQSIQKWIKSAGLEGKKKLFPRQMSGGEQQRAAILRAVVNSPSFLFADEPTGALDASTGDKIIKFLVSYAHASKMTILLVTHDMDVAKQCDRIIEMSDGKIIH